MSWQLLLGRALVLSSLFCYVNPFGNELDSQPQSLLIAMGFLLFTKSLKSYELTLLGLCLLFGMTSAAVALISGADFSLALRGIYNYLSIGIFMPAFRIIVRQKIFSVHYVYLAITSYIVVGIIQLALGVAVFDWLVAVRTTPDRGVTSLTPEPTYFGIVLFLFLLILDRSQSPNLASLIFFKIICGLSIILLAKSSMALIFLALYCCYVALRSGPHAIVSVSFGLIIVSSLTLSSTLEGSRIQHIIFALIDNPIELLKYDASINDRLSHIYLSIYGLFANYMAPGLFHTFEVYSESRAVISDGVFWFGGGTNKIMSFIGAIVYEMGILSAVVLAYLFRHLLDGRKIAFVFLCVIPPLFTAITLSNPLVYLMLNWVAYGQNSLDKNV